MLHRDENWKYSYSYSLNVASSGFRTVLAMVCDILQGLMDKRLSSQFARFEEARGVVLIDEVETHLHPRWKMQIMGAYVGRYLA
jgi:predicted ATP-binding protein involved in virulence